MTAYTGHQALPPALPQAATLEQAWRRLQAVANGMLKGQINNALSVTLTAGAASTTLQDPRIGGSTRLAFGPMTANAAAEVATMYYDAPTKNSVVIHHANNGQTDRTFSVLIGG